MLELNKIYLGDCLEVMKDIDDGSIDLILADPPYQITCCHWDSIIPLGPMWEHLKRIIKPDGAIVMTASQPFTTTLISSNMRMFKYCWYWRKSRPTGQLNAKKQPLRNVEDVCIFYDKQPTYVPQGIEDCNILEVNTDGRKTGNCFGDTLRDSYTRTKTNYPRQVLDFNSVHNVGSHPTQKPAALMEYLIKTYTNEGETVLDFAAGSGTTGVAAINTNRDFILIEKDEGYYEIAKKRLEDTIKDKAQQLF